MAKFEVIAPKSIALDPRKMEAVIERWLDMEAENVIVDFRATVQTWKSQPQFSIEKRKGERFVYTTDKIWKFIGITGTRIRYAVMSPDFKPKTRLGHLGSNKGKGGAVYMDFSHPRPGIESRKFDEAAGEKVIRYAPERIQRSINVEIRKMMK